MWARLTEEHLSVLRTNIDGWASFYANEDPWLSRQFEHEIWRIPIIELEERPIRLIESDDSTSDFINSKRIYERLRQIPRSLAVDEAFWAYLSHVTLWQYMRKRWPATDQVGRIRERYFFGSSSQHRSLVRHGIARLWWYAHITYDESLADPYELTRVLLQRISIAQSLLERSWSSNPMVTKAVLRAIQRANDAYWGRYDVRQVIRDDLPAYINQRAGVTVLDVLSPVEIEEIAFERIRSHARQTA